MLVMTILAGAVGGCGKSGGDNDPTSGPETGNIADQGQGRYVEKMEVLPGELDGWDILQIFEAGDRLHLLTSKQENGKTLLREWEKRESSFADVTESWLASMEIPGDSWMEAKLLREESGGQYLYVGYLEEDFMGHLWKGEGDTAKEITPEKWSVSNEDWGGYERIRGMAVLNNGTLAVLSYTSYDLLSGQDGSVIESEPLTNYYDEGIITDGENVYLGVGGQIERRKEGKGSDAVMFPLPKGNNSTMVIEMGGNFVSGGTENFSYDVQKNGTLIVAGEQGIFRLSDQTAEDGWEKLAEGIETDFALKDYWCEGLAAMEDGSIYALFEVNGVKKLNRYEYDPNGATKVTQVLKLYTICDNSLLKQAAVMYHKLHPEVRIDIQSEYPLYFNILGEQGLDEIHTKLNTMLMGEEAPDILVLDHLNLEAYAKKGLLMDLEELIRPMEESGELLDNITSTYIREDGTRYAVPLQFAFSMALGRDIAPDQMSSMRALADFLSKEDQSYLGKQTTAQLVDLFYPYFCDEIVREKQLNKEALASYLEYLKAIGDNCGVIPVRPENESAYNMMDLLDSAKLTIEKAGGFSGCMFPVSIAEFIKGDFAAFENRFIPSVQVGICTKGKYQETAKDFIVFALSQQIQDMDYYGGFPVNRVSMEKQASKDRSEMAGSVMVTTENGDYVEFEAKAFDEETMGRLVAICESLNKPVMEDVKIRQVLIECLGDYLQDSQSLDETIRKIEAGLKMYLAEGQFFPDT